MDDIKSVLNLITRDCFMASIGLKDAYYSVKVSKVFKIYLASKIIRICLFSKRIITVPKKIYKINEGSVICY